MQRVSLLSDCSLAAIAAAALTLASPLVSLAQETAPPTQTQTDIQFRVVEQTQFDLGDHKLIVNRVAPPVLRKQRAVGTPPPPPLSAEAVQIELRKQSKKSAVLFLSATVYDREVTQLSWFGEGGECRAFSNIDFNFLNGLGEIETDDTVYTILLGLGNESRAAAAAQIPFLNQFSPTRAEYFVVGENGTPATVEALAGLDALHTYYNANRVKLAEDYKKREATRVKRETWLKAHPPVPRDTVINFWPADNRQLREMKTKEGQQ